MHGLGLVVVSLDEKQRHKLSIKMRSKLLFWNIPQSLSKNSSNSASIQILMQRNGQSLLCSIG